MSPVQVAPGRRPEKHLGQGHRCSNSVLPLNVRGSDPNWPLPVSLWHYPPMKKFALFLVIAVLAYGYVQEQGVSVPWLPTSIGSDDALQDAFANRQSNVQVKGEGTVTKILADDLEGSRHQRFIVRLASGQTLLVSHNIDLAPRVANLGVGDSVAFFGEFEWNPKGGVVHWTHHDPKGRHVGGWIKHRGRTYQ